MNKNDEAADLPSLFSSITSTPGADGAPPRPSEYVYSDVPPCHTNALPTEQAAAEAAASFAPTLRVEVLQFIRDQAENGCTDKELGRHFAALSGAALNDASVRYSVAPRRVELRDAGFVEATGRTRERSTVWRATDKVGDGRVCLRAIVATS